MPTPVSLSPVSTSIKPLWDARELAQRLGIHRTRLYGLVRTGRIPHLRIGRAIRFDPASIRAWEQSGGWASPNLKPRGSRQAAERGAKPEHGQ
jgi:excisionase family DNA binding protein